MYTAIFLISAGFGIFTGLLKNLKSKLLGIMLLPGFFTISLVAFFEKYENGQVGNDAPMEVVAYIVIYVSTLIIQILFFAMVEVVREIYNRVKNKHIS